MRHGAGAVHVVLVGPELEENLSLRYLAASLRQAGHSADLARFDGIQDTAAVVDRIVGAKPGLVGLSIVFQARAGEFRALVSALRDGGYRGHITAGGHYATFAYEELLRDVLGLDSVVRQEGEHTIAELASALAGRPARPGREGGAGCADLGAIPGMVVRASDGGLLVGPLRRQADNLDALAPPTRDTPPELHLGVPTAFMVGSRGCYADCDYCCIRAWHEAALGKRFRLRSAGNIADEMSWLYHERGVRFFVFHDDNFFLPTVSASRRRILELRAQIRERRLDGIGLMLKLRPNDCDRENLVLLKEIGLLRTFVGIENASARQLRSMGRVTSLSDLDACLRLLRELDIYATFNVLLFDPYTTLDDVSTNLAFLRANLRTPFNWCKVEPYAGTALEARYAREGRLRGSRPACTYTMDDARSELLYNLLLPAFRFRNYDYYGLSNRNMGLGYHLQLLKHFYPGRLSPGLARRVQGAIVAVNGSAVRLMSQALRFSRSARLDDGAAIERFGEQLRNDSVSEQRRLSGRVESAWRLVEQAAGLRNGAEPEGVLGGCEHGAARDGPARRVVLAALGGAVVALVSGCGDAPQADNQPPEPAVVAGATPTACIMVAPGHSLTIAGGESFVLHAMLAAGVGDVVGEPRVVTTGGQILSAVCSASRRGIRITYCPDGTWTLQGPDAVVTAVWTLRGKQGDTVVAARAFIHGMDDCGYAFGYGNETLRPTVCEMAAPPMVFPRP